MIIPHDVAGHVRKVKNAKIAIFTCSLQAADTETKGTVLIHNADELMKYNIGEEKEIERIIRSIAESGVNVIVTGQTIDDMAQHFIEKHGMMVIKLTSQHELRRLCRATKARPLVQLGPLAKEDIGLCSRVFVREVGSQNVIIFQQDKNDATAISTILLRASTNNILNDIERAVDDGVNVVKAMVKDGRFVAGAGAVDIELARRLTAIGAKSKGLDQYAIKKFAEAFEVVPRTLAENAGLVAVDIISQLYTAHEKNQPNAGVNIEDGGVKDMTKDGILDLLCTKRQAIFLATDAVLTILRVDQIIQAKPAGGPKIPKKQGHWDDED
jgi:T-complex protein 1 subunit theta